MQALIDSNAELNRALSRVACAMIQQAARDLTLPTEITAGMTSWQRITREENRFYKQSALVWVNEEGSPSRNGSKDFSYLSLATCCRLINTYLCAGRWHALDDVPDVEVARVRRLLHLHPQEVVRIMGDVTECINAGKHDLVTARCWTVVDDVIAAYGD